MSGKDSWPREKRWKDLYTRSDKVARADQLGFDYPRVSENQLLREAASEFVGEGRNVLFVCSRNQWRSPTAEQVWRKHPKLSVRSAGTSPNARRKLSVEDIRWADVILVMEEKHKSRLLAEFTRVIAEKPVHVMDIPDNYKFMDPELVEELQSSVAAILGLECDFAIGRPLD